MERRSVSIPSHAGLIKEKRFIGKIASGFRRDATILLFMAIFTSICAADLNYAFVSPTAQSSVDVFNNISNAYDHFLIANISFTYENASSCILALSYPNQPRANFSMGLSGNSCYGNVTITALGNYTYRVILNNSYGNLNQTVENWAIGQWCDSDLNANLTLAGNLNANLLTTNNCFTGDASNIELDCNGYNITAVSGATEYAIKFGGSNTSVKNCKFSGPWSNSYVFISDFVGGNQTGFQLLNNWFDPSNEPNFGDVITDFGSTDFANYTKMAGNNFSHTVIISGNMRYLDFMNNSFAFGSKIAQSTIAGGTPKGLIFEETGNGQGKREHWNIEGNSCIIELGYENF